MSHSAKQQVREIVQFAQKKANKDFKKKYLPKLEGLDLLDQIAILSDEIKAIKKKSKQLDCKMYYKNHSSNDFLIRTFLYRATLLQIEESETFFEAIYLGNLRRKITHHKSELSETVPKITFNDFLKKSLDPRYLDFYKYGWHFVDEENYHQVVAWQTEKVLQIVSAETSQIIATVQKQSILTQQTINILSEDLELYESKIEKIKFKDINDLIDKVKSVSFLSNLITSSFKDEHLEDFHTLQKETLPTEKLSSTYLNQQSDAVLLERKNSSPPIFFITLIKVFHWVESIVNGTSLFTEHKPLEVEKLRIDTIEKAHSIAAQEIEEFENTIDYSLPDIDLINIYLQEIEEIRLQLNKSGMFKHYFTNVFNPELLTVLFDVNAFLSNTPEYEISELRKAVIYKEKLYHYYYNIRDIKGVKQGLIYEHLYPQLYGTGLLGLLNDIILDDDLFRKSSKIIHKALKDFMVFIILPDLIFKNTFEALHNLFYEAINRLSRHLEYCPTNQKIIYLQERLRSLKLQQFEKHKYEFGYNEDNNSNSQYLKHFREYLEIETEFIKETKDISFIPSNKLLPEPKKQISKKAVTSNFGFKQDPQVLKTVLIQLTNKIYLLNENKTTVEELHQLLTASDIVLFKKQIHFNCENTQLWYIIKKLQPYFKDLTFSNIGATKLFVSKNGSILSAANLTSSKNDNPKEKDTIGKILALFH